MALLTMILLLVPPVFYFIFLFFKLWKSKSKTQSLPIHWPFFGMLPGLLLNAHQVLDYTSKVLEGCSNLTFEFKGPWFANMDMLITSNPNNVHYILSKNFSNFDKGPQFKQIFDILGDGIFNAERESWESQRKIALSLLNHKDFPDLVVRVSLKKVEQGLIPVLDHMVQLEREIDLQEIFQKFTLDSTCMLVLGHDPLSLCIGLPNFSYEKAFADAEEAILYRHVVPETYWKIQKWLQIGREKKLNQAKDNLNQFLAHCISLKMEQKMGEQEENSDLLTNYMRALEEKSGSKLADHDSCNKVWRDTLLNLIFAGRDTVSAGLSWFFWLLTTNPSEERKVREEIILKNCDLHFLDVEKLKNLNYLHGALCEALRLYPPVAMQHKAPLEADILPSGHSINANTRTVLSFYSMGRMESIWGKDCLEFKPSRWMTEHGGLRHEPSFKFTAFNAGPRSCLGKDISFMQMKIVAVAILLHFDIHLVKDHPVCYSNSVILHMEHGLKVKVSKRRLEA